ncbi:MAG TPA: hypothetical protein VL200_02970 [Lacunisphaera sp.]|jgi:hypothetical protein|nr:hypothetical protein [Lacunisphaera sp.]
MTPLLIRAGVWTWLIAAVVVGHLGLLRRVPMPAVQGILFGLTALVLVLCFRVRALRAWIEDLDLRSLVALHFTRFVGIYFLILYRRGELPYEFAVPGGWGDIAVATLALVVVFVPMGARLGRSAIGIWNAMGLFDILLVVFTAARIGLAKPWLMAPLTELPLSLLPTFLVPLIIATHVLIYVRLRREFAAA